MSIQTYKKVGVVTGISMLIGSIIGSGIYFKNNDVFNTTNYSAMSTGVAWILASIISLLLAISFSEIGRMKNQDNEEGTTLWIRKLLPKYLSNTLSPFYAVFYFSIYALILGFLSSKFFVDALSIYKILDADTISPIIHLAIGAFLNLFLLLAHYFSRKVMSIVQVMSLILKLIPLTVVIIAGLILFDSHNYIPKLNSNKLAGKIYL